MKCWIVRRLPVAEMGRQELSGEQRGDGLCTECWKGRVRDCCTVWTSKVDTARRSSQISSKWWHRAENRTGRARKTTLRDSHSIQRIVRQHRRMPAKLQVEQVRKSPVNISLCIWHRWPHGMSYSVSWLCHPNNTCLLVRKVIGDEEVGIWRARSGSW